ncbi:MAG: hypothetical protein HY064_09160 [Bacteroidetes bacterium]|nr:hypothetical protein [Bacteroidota bacterium]
MKAHHTEKHRLTTLQKQILLWLKNEGGGVLRVDRLFTAMVNNHQTPGTNFSLLAERLYDAVDDLARRNYVEVRKESETKRKQALSIYDFGAPGKNFSHEGEIFIWSTGECPVVALADEGVRHAAAI